MTPESDATGPLARLEVEIAATPEQVWEAIATEHGNAGWLFPMDIEPRQGGRVVIHRAPYGGDAAATVTAWDPPRRFAYDEDTSEWAGADAPPWATEILVEGRGGTTVVRLVSGFSQGGDEWEDMVAGAGEGWTTGLQLLRLYTTHFLGQPPTAIGATGYTGTLLSERAGLSRQLFAALGVTGLSVGDKVRGPDDAPPLAGVVEYASDDTLIVRSDDPGPGVFEISTFSMDGRTLTVNVAGRLYGDDMAQPARRDTPRWGAWIAERFALVDDPTLLRA